MRTAEMRIEALHARMEAREQARERRKTTLLGAGCCALSAFLLLVIFSTSHRGGSAGLYSGATMLFDDAGGYVLAAVAAFMIGVILTAVFIGMRKRRADQAKAENGGQADEPED